MRERLCISSHTCTELIGRGGSLTAINGHCRGARGGLCATSTEQHRAYRWRGRGEHGAGVRLIGTGGRRVCVVSFRRRALILWKRAAMYLCSRHTPAPERRWPHSRAGETCHNAHLDRTGRRPQAGRRRKLVTPPNAGLPERRWVLKIGLENRCGNLHAGCQHGPPGCWPGRVWTLGHAGSPGSGARAARPRVSHRL